MPQDINSEYATWAREQESMLKRLTGKEVIVLFSGGKDSSLLLYFLHAATKEYDFTFEVHASAFPKHRYMPSDVNRIDAFWGQRDVKIWWHDVEDPDDCLEQAHHPCIDCQRLRKRQLYEGIQRTSVDLKHLVLIAAYTLWDLVSYSLEFLMGATYTDPHRENALSSQKRFFETGQRFYPIMTMRGGWTIYRPVLKYNKQDVVQVIQDASIPVLSVPCRYARLRPKRILETYYESMRLYFDYDRVVTFAKESLDLPSMSEYTPMNGRDFLKSIF
jgi:tRNA(Ile)-lysidine synthase TilS/MesJ